MTGSAGTIYNSSTITGAHGITLSAGGTVTNYTNASASGQSTGIYASSVAANIVNGGTINGSSDAGIELDTRGSVNNQSSGSITAPITASSARARPSPLRTQEPLAARMEPDIRPADHQQCCGRNDDRPILRRLFWVGWRSIEEQRNGKRNHQEARAPISKVAATW